MNTNIKGIGAITIAFCLILSGCGPGQLLGSTFTPPPTSTQTPIPTSTQTPTPTPTLTQTPTNTPTITPTPVSISIKELKIGEYVKFGKYADEPIFWRVIGDSANPNAIVGDKIIGNPLLFSDKVICFKAYDAAGPHDDIEQRLNDGSNLWQTSNIRAWLNSSAEAGAVLWPDGNPPTEGSVESNAYANEKGFLAEGNFTEYELNLIKPVTQKALLYRTDKQLAEGGSIGYRYHDEIENIVNNYDNAWYHNVTDKVFLLDPKQVNSVYNLFGSYYHDNHEDYWLRAPDTSIYTDSSPANVLYIRKDGTVMYRRAKKGDIGVRPALTLNRELIIFFQSGDGSNINPYIITRP